MVAAPTINRGGGASGRGAKRARTGQDGGEHVLLDGGEHVLLRPILSKAFFADWCPQELCPVLGLVSHEHRDALRRLKVDLLVCQTPPTHFCAPTHFFCE